MRQSNKTKSSLGTYSLKQVQRDLDELGKWMADKPSAFRKVPVAPVSQDEVRKARKAVGLTQAKFAAVLGVNPMTVRFWENGQRSPDGTVRKVLRLITKRPEVALELARV